jgi:hypothetical protein
VAKAKRGQRAGDMRGTHTHSRVARVDGGRSFMLQHNLASVVPGRSWSHHTFFFARRSHHTLQVQTKHVLTSFLIVAGESALLFFNQAKHRCSIFLDRVL